MIACAFAACSNDDDPIVGPENPITGDVETTLAFAIKGADTKTKAQTAAEEKVNSLRVILYTEGGQYVASTTTAVNEDGIDDNREVEFTNIKLPSGVTRYKVLAVANLSTDFTSNVDAELAAIEQGVPFGTASINSNGLPMSSGVSAAFDVVLGKKNYYGYKGVATIVTNDEVNNIGTDPLPLIRNVARVDLEKITLNLNASTKKPEYTTINASLQLQEAFILHARTKAAAADLTSTPAWWNSTSGAWGSIAAQYTAKTTELVSGRTTFDTAPVASFENVVGGENPGYSTTFSGDDYKITQSSTNAASKALTGISFYILENDQTTAAREISVTDPDVVSNHSYEYATELVIKGEYEVVSAIKGNDTYKYKKETRYWPIKIGISGITGEGGGYGSVHRNYIYTIEEAIIAGPGMKDPTKPEPDPLQLFVRTKVVDWGNATQKPTIE